MDFMDIRGHTASGKAGISPEQYRGENLLQ
jgi:hypothetical protein